MPSTTGVKRMKGKRIERNFLIGSEAWPLDATKSRKPDTPADHSKGWRVYVKAPQGQPHLTTWLRKVQFKIFHTYPNATRIVEEPPFQIEETGWGGFTVEIKLFLVPEANWRPQDRQHFLQLEPFGNNEQQEQQKNDLLVRSEVMDTIEFNEPTEQFFNILTDPRQFNATLPKGGLGKGKGKGKAAAANSDGTCEVPEESTNTNPYSKTTEREILALFEKARTELENQIAEDQSRETALRTTLDELRSSG